MEAIWQDLRLGLRVLASKPAFTAVAVLTLALGIGATTAIFSVVNAVLLRPLPYEDPEELVLVWETHHGYGLPLMYASPPNYADWRARNRVFDDVAVFRPRRYFLQREDVPLRVPGSQVSSSLFQVLRVVPHLGRVFSADDDLEGAEPVVLLGYELWRSRFGGETSVVGSSVVVDEVSRTVVGVLPPGFKFPPPIALEGFADTETPQIWTTFARSFADPSQRQAHFLSVIARLRSGVSLAQASRDMNALHERIAEENPGYDGWTITLVPLDEQILAASRLALWTLLGAVALVLLIACVNVANLLLAHGAGRTREFAIRAALGAASGRMVRQLLTESLLLAVVGGAVGVAFALWCTRTLVAITPHRVPRLDEVGIDLHVLGFALAITLVTGLLFGLAPALQASSTELSPALKEGGRGGLGRGHVRLRDLLVVAEVALSLVLLIGAGLLFRTFLNLRGVDPGFQPDDVLSLRVTLPRSYAEPAERAEAFFELGREIRALPGVEAAGFVLEVPFSSDRQGTTVRIEGDEAEDGRQINRTWVTPGYFRAAGIPLLVGRDFTERDGSEGRRSVIVNRTFADRFLTGRDPLSVRVFYGDEAVPIVGVVGDVLHDKLTAPANPAAYQPYAGTARWRSMALAVRSPLPPAQLIPVIRERIAAVVPAAPVFDVKTLRQVIADSMAESRFLVLLLTVFAGAALLLSAVGIYGVLSYAVAQRLREMGVRMALGARGADILRVVLGDGLKRALAGVAAGLVLALLLTRYLETLLYGVRATDPATLVTICAVLLLTAALACFVPAWRARGVDPLEALRHE